MHVADRAVARQQSHGVAALLDSCATTIERLAAATGLAAERVRAEATSSEPMRRSARAGDRLAAELAQTLASKVDALEVETNELARMLARLRVPADPPRRERPVGVRVLVARMAEAGDSRSAIEQRLREFGVADPARIATEVIQENAPNREAR